MPHRALRSIAASFEAFFRAEAVGGTAIRLWTPDYDGPASAKPDETNGKHYATLMTGVKAVRAKHAQAIPLAAFWLQGESDAASALATFGTDTAIVCYIQTMEAERDAPERHRKTYFGNNTWEACVKALRSITGEKMEEDPKAWRTWHEGGLKAGLAGMTSGLTHQDAAVRTLAATRLGQHAEKAKALDALLTAVATERNPTARIAMVKTLGAIRDVKARDTLVTVLEAKGSKTLEEHVALARALDDVGDGRGTNALIEMLSSEDSKDWALAARALSEATGEPLHYDIAKWRAWWKTYGERYRQ